MEDASKIAQMNLVLLDVPVKMDTSKTCIISTNAMVKDLLQV